MKTIFTWLLLICSLLTLAQGETQEIALEGAVAVHIYAAFSSVSVTTGGTDALAVDYLFTVDGADRSDLHKLTVERINGVIHLREIKPTARLLKAELSDPKGNMVTAPHQEGKGVFNDVILDATLNVVVPVGVRVTVETNYGGIAAINVPGLVSARAKYGGVNAAFLAFSPRADLDLYSNYGVVDLTLPAATGLDLDLTTEYGELLTDVNIEVNDAASMKKEFYQRIIGSVNGGGGKVRCRAPYGNVCLRTGSE